MWKDNCHKCGRQIFNGIPNEYSGNIEGFIKKMKEEGYVLGYNTSTIGVSWGDIREKPIKPICKICSKEESDKKQVKETKKAVRKISKIIKKEFSCPICEYSQRHGNDVKVFKCSSKQEMINHIKEKHTLSEIKNVLPSEGYYATV